MGFYPLANFSLRPAYFPGGAFGPGPGIQEAVPHQRGGADPDIRIEKSSRGCRWGTDGKGEC